MQSSIQTESIRRRRRSGLQITHPSIPGAANNWYPSQDQARNAALRAATQYGPGYSIAHDPRPARGLPHYHVIDPTHHRVSGHFFYGRRLPRRVYRGRHLREGETNGDGQEYFVIHNRLLRIPEGHERLNRDAARSFTGITPADLSAMIDGVRRVDYGLIKHFRSQEQRRHALRKHLGQPLLQALQEIRAHLRLLHHRALTAMSTGARRQAFEWLGEALHLIQDSYAPAHTERVWGTGSRSYPITYIRYFGLCGNAYPIEHRVFPIPDPRDSITTTEGVLTRAAHAAITARREFLRMMVRHLNRPRSPSNSSELRTFMRRHLSLSSRPTNPRRYYRCR